MASFCHVHGDPFLDPVLGRTLDRPFRSRGASALPLVLVYDTTRDFMKTAFIVMLPTQARTLGYGENPARDGAGLIRI
jgi:hypothetical protein